MRVGIGLLLVLASIVLRDFAIARLFQLWHSVDPRAWAEVVRPARRRWPFSAFLWSRVTEPYARWWLYSTAGLAGEVPIARLWIWAHRTAVMLLPVGFFVCVSGLP